MKSNHFFIMLKGIIFSFLALSIFISCSKKEEDEEKPKEPVASFTFTPVSPKVNEAVTFNNTSTDATTFQWSAAGTSFSSTEKNPTFTFTEEGDFTVTLVATGEGGSNTTTREISIAPADVTAPAPVAAFSFSPTNPQTGQEVTFTNESQNATSYEWSSERAGFSSTEENPTFTFDTDGEFEVKLVAKNADGDSNETTQTITVITAEPTPDPIAAFSFSPSSPTAGEEVTFTNESQNATSYEWSAVGTSFSSTEENPTFTFDADGSFEVKLVAKNADGDSDETTQTVTVSASTPAPVAAFSFTPANPKAGEEVTFINESQNATSFQWSAAGTSFNSTEENPKFTFDTDGVVEVKLVVSNSAGTSETTTSITIEAASTGGNPCNLPECYVERTTSATAGGNVTVTYSYTTVNGKKLPSQISTSTIGGTFVTNIQYDAQGRRIKDESRFGATLSNYVEYEYSNNDRTVRANGYDASGNLTGYSISEYDANNRLTRTDNYDAAGTLTGYTVYSDFLSIEGSFPQLVETFDASGALTQKDVYTYQDCQLIKTVSTDGSGTLLGEVENTIDARGLLRTSKATIYSQAGTIVSNTDYVYDCD
ncbi:PKD domain-containing protein [Bernardetia sp.]|uniref:PKD domain-containing protein n=1 Tax=Bernardetia sp. TaxID=1937974 RepID=UPI0025C6AFFF|nr:PKD domain-containing protein [Bernardetia sp.]